jgi:hypothetical protein
MPRRDAAAGYGTIPDPSDQDLTNPMLQDRITP